MNENIIENIKTKESYKKSIYIKFSPLLDPLRYMTGKYDMNDDKIRSLPSYNTTENESISKLLSYHNASYVDCFFTFLTSKALNNHNFIHGINFYGTYLGIQDRFKMNVVDDLEYLLESSFFTENINNYYTITKNEEHFVKRWADSAREADLLLMADTGSSDNTVQVARDNGIVVHEICITP